MVGPAGPARPVRPAGRQRPSRPRARAGEHGVGPGQVAGDAHDVLPVGVGDGLAHRGLGAGLPAGEDGRDHPEAQDPEDLALYPDVDEAVTGRGVGRPAGVPDQIHQVVGGRAHPPQGALAAERDPLVAQRHLRQVPAAVLGPDEVVGRDPDVVEEDLVEGMLARHVDERTDLDARRIHRAHEVADAHVLGGSRVGAGEEDPPLGDVGVAGPHLLPVDHVVVALAFGPRRQRRQVRPGAGLGEQLAPELLATEERPEPALLLLLAACVHQGWPRPSDADRVDRAPHAGSPELLVDHELGQWVGVEPVGRSPVGHDVPRPRRGGGRSGAGARPASP